tara:strand:+ start:411 stop:1304 length:894 start_codon:yes stop_codon:yes gene_type:complete
MFLEQNSCKICSSKGVEIFKTKFGNKEILNFFNSEYGEKTSNFLKKKIGKKNFILKKCSVCQFIWQKNIPKIFFLKQLYDKIIDPIDSLKKSRNVNIFQKKYFENEINFFQNFHKKKNLNILDFGAGWGTWLICIKKNCPSIFAMEFSSIRKKHLIKNDIKVINFKDKKYNNYFHVVRLEQVLEHISNLKGIIFDLKKIIKKGGILSIGVPNGKYEIKKEIIKLKKGPIQPLEHLNCFNNKSLKILFGKNGFKSISVFEIITTFLRTKRFDYHNIRYILALIKNSLLSTKINFVKIK